MRSPIFTKTLINGGHVRSFQISPTPEAGWLASEEADRCVVRRQECSDWHRVERIVSRFRGEVAELHREGWTEL